MSYSGDGEDPNPDQFSVHDDKFGDLSACGANDLDGWVTDNIVNLMTAKLHLHVHWYGIQFAIRDWRIP